MCAFLGHLLLIPVPHAFVVVDGKILWHGHSNRREFARTVSDAIRRAEVASVLAASAGAGGGGGASGPRGARAGGGEGGSGSAFGKGKSKSKSGAIAKKRE